MGGIIDYIKISTKKPNVRQFTKFLKKNYDNKKLVGIEIGVATGRNALSLLQNLDIDKLYLVDPYLFHPEKYKEHPFNIAKKNLKKYSDRIVWIKLRSEQAIDKIPKDVDFVYIDGDHSYDYVVKDVNLYWNKVKKNGILGGHDFVPCYFGVVQAVCEFKEKMKLDIFGKDGDWWFIKNK